MRTKLSEYLPTLYLFTSVVTAIGLQLGIVIKYLSIFGKPSTVPVWPNFALILSFCTSRWFPPENEKLRKF